MLSTSVVASGKSLKLSTYWNFPFEHGKLPVTSFRIIYIRIEGKHSVAKGMLKGNVPRFLREGFQKHRETLHKSETNIEKLFSQSFQCRIFLVEIFIAFPEIGDSFDYILDSKRTLNITRDEFV